MTIRPRFYSALCAAVALSWLVASVVSAAQLSAQDFAYARTIETPGKASAYRVALPADVYRKTVRTDLGDIRVFNARGEPVPYSLTRAPVESPLREPAKRLPLFPLKGDPVTALAGMRSTIEAGKALHVQASNKKPSPQPILSYIADGRSLRVPVAAMQLEWPDDAGEFAGRLKVETGGDLDTWRTVTEAAPVANLHSDGGRIVERQVDFPAIQAKFWRLSWAGPAPPFALTGVYAEPAGGRVDAARSELAVRGTAAAGRPGETTFDLGAPLPVDRINFKLPEQNSIVQIELQSRAIPADPWIAQGKHGFYRLQTRNGEMRNGPVAIATSPNRYWRARIDEDSRGLGDGPPQLEVGWVAREVVFLARGQGPYQLAYGSGAAQRCESSSSIPRGVQIVSATLGAERELGGVARLKPPPPPFPWKSALLWTVLAVGVALLAWMAYRLSRQL